MIKNIKPGRIQSGAGDRVFDVVNYVFLSLVALIIFYPLYFVLIASFTTPRVVNSGRFLLYPVEFFLGGYTKAFTHKPIWIGYLNSIIYTFLGTAGSIFTTITSAYALSRSDMAGRRFFMFLFTFTMFFGGGMIPFYLLVKAIGIYDTLWAMVLPGAISVYNLIVCRTFFETTLPKELYEASVLDGCTDFQYFIRVAVPLSSTIITVMALFYGAAKWNSYFDALILMMDNDKMPLQIVLRQLLLIARQAENTFSNIDAKSMAERRNMADQLKYCLIVVSAAPPLIIYPFLQKYFAKGVMIGAVKG